MFLRLINLALILTTLVGLVSLIRHQRQESNLGRERARLVKQFGFMEVEDPSLFYLLPVTQKEPAHYIWRVHIPDNAELVLKCKHLSGSASSWLQTRPEQMTMRFRFGIRKGKAYFYLATDGGSSYGSLGMPPELAQYLWDHWEELNIELAATDDLIASDFSKPQSLLRVSVPDEMIKDILENVPETRKRRWDQRLADPLFVVRCGTPEAMEDQP